MSAVMQTEVRGTITVLDPSGRGHELLQTWALYRRGGERSHSPFVSGYLKEPLDKAHENEPDSVLAIDRILSGLVHSGYEQSVEVVKRYYLSESTIAEIEAKMHRTRGFIRLTLRGIAGLVESRIPE